MSQKAEQTPALHNLWMMTNIRIQMQKESSWPELITVVHPNPCFSEAFGAYALRHASLHGFAKNPSLSLSLARERERDFYIKNETYAPCIQTCTLHFEHNQNDLPHASTCCNIDTGVKSK